MNGLNSSRTKLHLGGLLANILAVMFAFIAASHAQEPAQQQVESIHVSVDLVNVGVIVTDAKGRFVENLQRDDFHVFDSGSEQPIKSFASVEEPAQVLLLIEAGPAVYLLEEGHLRAANSLLRGLSPGDRVAVAKYDAAPQAVLDFTTDKEYAGTAFGQLRFNLGIGALNLSSSLSTVMDWLKQVPGKKSIVLLSSGLDTSPDSSWNSLVQRLKISEVRILAVSLTGGLRPAAAVPQKSKKKPAPEKPSATTQQFDRADAVLKQLAESSGGRAYFPKTQAEFGAVYAQIANLLRHEYSLAFSPPARDSAVHIIDVRIAVSGAPSAAFRIDHRQAYVAPPPIAP
jgi:Ca-activated chloride channel family protein